ncbi:MAG: Cytochrome bd-I ubiquinol oxidase subunit 2 [Chlamydiia bacterium]|nr:Cytochrome bd-I ubiquinol oxidase subunit 2 [Chlamydiia bacterium]
MFTLELIWYCVICLSVVAYVILDGFDLGVGMVHLFTSHDEERRLMLNAIGPVWDGNEVWIIIVGGGLLAGFPAAYATLCSAFYVPFMIFLAGIIFRAVSIEFRSKLHSMRWRHFWDAMFSISSYVISFVLGVLLGNLVKGIPIDAEGVFHGSFWSFFTPYTILMGITGIALFMMHGCIYLAMKTEGEFHNKVSVWSISTMVFFIISYVTLTLGTLTFMPHMHDLMREMPYLYAIGLCAMLLIANIPRCLRKHEGGWAFLSSAGAIFFLLVLFGMGVYPNLIRSSMDPVLNSITLYNAASSKYTLRIILTVAGIGVPLVIAYGWWIYRIFRGKVKLDTWSY